NDSFDGLHQPRAQLRPATATPSSDRVLGFGPCSSLSSFSSSATTIPLRRRRRKSLPCPSWCYPPLRLPARPVGRSGSDTIAGTPWTLSLAKTARVASYQGRKLSRRQGVQDHLP